MHLPLPGEERWPGLAVGGDPAYAVFRWWNVEHDDVVAVIGDNCRSWPASLRPTHSRLRRAASGSPVEAEIIHGLKRYVAREIFNALPMLVAQNNSAHPPARPWEHRLWCRTQSSHLTRASSFRGSRRRLIRLTI